jgi:hypothetical protein
LLERTLQLLGDEAQALRHDAPTFLKGEVVETRDA